MKIIWRLMRRKDISHELKLHYISLYIYIHTRIYAGCSKNIHLNLYACRGYREKSEMSNWQRPDSGVDSQGQNPFCLLVILELYFLHVYKCFFLLFKNINMSLLVLIWRNIFVSVFLFLYRENILKTKLIFPECEFQPRPNL